MSPCTEKSLPSATGAVVKLKDTHTGNTLCEAKKDIKLTPVAIPEPAISFALEAESKGDENKLATALVKIRDEDPTISVGRDPQTIEVELVEPPDGIGHQLGAVGPLVQHPRPVVGRRPGRRRALPPEHEVAARSVCSRRSSCSCSGSSCSRP